MHAHTKQHHRGREKKFLSYSNHTYFKDRFTGIAGNIY